MADPMTNMEIEDVLSSIRRLVSEDLRPGFRPESPVETPPAPPQPAALDGRLVLTPAFRVADAPVAKPQEPQAWRRAASRFRTELEEGVPDPAVPEQAETGFSAHFESRAEEPSDIDIAAEFDLPAAEIWPDVDDRDVTSAQSAFDSGDGGALAPQVADYDYTPPEPDRPAASDREMSEAATLEAAISDLEAAVAASADDWEPDGSELTAGSHFVLPPMGSGRVSPELAEAYGADQGAGPAGLRRLHLEPGTFPDDPAEPVWADRDGGAPPAREPVESQPASLFGDEAMPDEGMLRELVIEVIRQELQGALGERITRNVRKLVRAEIHRALAGREFE